MWPVDRTAIWLEQSIHIKTTIQEEEVEKEFNNITNNTGG